MTLILKLNLDMIKMYLYTKNEVPSFSSSKVIAWTDTQTDTQKDTQTDTQTDTQKDTQTDTQTHRPDWNYYLSANADGKNNYSNRLMFFWPVFLRNVYIIFQKNQDMQCTKRVEMNEHFCPSLVPVVTSPYISHSACIGKLFVAV